MIESFADEATRDVFLARDTRRARQLPQNLWPVMRRKLAMVDAAAANVSDLRIPPGNRLEPLKSEGGGRWSIRVNDQYRITFEFDGGSCREVRCEDYH